VVVLVILEARAGLAIVAAPGRQPRSMERVDGGAVRAGDRDMGGPAPRPVGVDPQVRLAVAAEARGALTLHQELVAKRAQRLLIERLALLQVADPQANMVDHWRFSLIVAVPSLSGQHKPAPRARESLLEASGSWWAPGLQTLFSQFIPVRRRLELGASSAAACCRSPPSALGAVPVAVGGHPAVCLTSARSRCSVFTNYIGLSRF